MPQLESDGVIVMTNADSYAAVLPPVRFSSPYKPAEPFLTKDGKIVE